MNSYEKNEIAKIYLKKIDDILDEFSIEKRTKKNGPLATRKIDLIKYQINMYESDIVEQKQNV